MNDEELIKQNREAAASVAPPSVEEQLEEYKDKYFRLLAETENMRKRMQKEKQEMTRFSIEQIVADLLLPLDNLENALKFANQMEGEVKNWATGFQMIATQFKDALLNHDVAPFSSVGQQFDPSIHEAVEVEHTNEHPEGTVLHEFIKGYKSKERTIRPARVKVAKAPLTDESQNLESIVKE